MGPKWRNDTQQAGTEAALTRTIRRLRPALPAAWVSSLLVLALSGSVTFALEASAAGPTGREPEARAAAKEGQIKRRERARDRASADAKREREASRSRYKGRSRAEAHALAIQKFRTVMTNRPDREEPLAPGQSIEKYIGPQTARVSNGAGQPDSLTVSTTPLRAVDETGDPAPVDYDLVAGEDAYRYANPAVAVRLHKRLSDGLLLEKLGVGLRPVTATHSDPISENGRLFWSSVATDLDFFVNPASSGFEFLLQIRSPEAPEDFAVDLDLPAGAVLVPPRTTSDPVTIRRGDEDIATIKTPTAWDADGEPVPATATVSGGRLTLRFEHRNRDIAYPALVDPLVSGVIYDDFLYWKTDYGIPFGRWWFQNHTRAMRSDYYADYRADYRGRGLVAQLYPYQWYDQYDFGQWLYEAPRANTFIYRAEFHQAYHRDYYTNLYEGVYNSAAQRYEDGSTDTSGSPWFWPYYLQNDTKVHCVHYYYESRCAPNPRSRNIAVFGIQVNTSMYRETDPYSYLTGARVFLADTTYPRITSVTSRQDLGRWYQPSRSLEADVAATDDQGLGMRSVSVPGRSEAYPSDFGCEGDHDSQCQDYMSGYLRYSLSGLSDGYRTLVVRAADVLSKTSDRSLTVKVDGTNPTMALSGDLASRDGQALTGGTYPLSISASDATSGVASIQVRVDGGRRASWNNGNGADGASQSESWTLDLNDSYYREGAHKIEVIVADRAGNRATRLIRFVKDHRSPTLTSASHAPTLPTQWVDDAQLSVTARGHDYGAGVRKATFRAPTAAGGEQTAESTSFSCSGGYFSRCPHRRNLLEDSNWSWEWETASPWTAGNGQLGHWYVGPLIHGGVHFSARRWPGSGDGWIWYDSARQPVVAGRTYSGHHYARPEWSDVVRGDFRSEIVFWDANGNVAGHEFGPLAYEEAPGTWKRSGGVRGIAPANATTASIRMAWNVRDGFEQWHNADAAHLEEEIDSSRTVSYSTGSLAEGRLTGDSAPRVLLEDAAGRQSPPTTWTLKVDHTRPDMVLSGPLWDLRTDPDGLVNNPTELVIDATDGDRAQPATERSGVKRIDVMLDDEPVYTSGDVACPDGSCSLRRSFELSSDVVAGVSDQIDGMHDLRVIAIDHLDHRREVDLSIFVNFGERALPLTDDPDADDSGYGEAEEGTYCYEAEEPESDYCGEDDASNLQLQAALAEPSIGDPLDGALETPSASAAAIAAGSWGMSDEHGDIFSDDRYRALNLKKVRKIIPYNLGDIMDRVERDNYTPTRAEKNDLDGFKGWYEALPRNGGTLTVKPLVSFQLRQERRATKRGQAPFLPSVNVYRAAVRKFMLRHPDIREFTAWNEPNLDKQPTSVMSSKLRGTDPYKGARMAGAYWNALHGLCARDEALKGCVVAAGDFLDARMDSKGEYLAAYKRGARIAPPIWAWHAYQGGRLQSLKKFQDFLRATKGVVWLTEQGALRKQVRREGRRFVEEFYSASDAESDLRWMLSKLISARYGSQGMRVKRFYYYQYVSQRRYRASARAKLREEFDTGLLGIDNTLDIRDNPPRSTYCVYRQKTNPSADEGCP